MFMLRTTWRLHCVLSLWIISSIAHLSCLLFIDIMFQNCRCKSPRKRRPSPTTQ